MYSPFIRYVAERWVAVSCIALHGIAVRLVALRRIAAHCLALPHNGLRIALRNVTISPPGPVDERLIDYNFELRNIFVSQHRLLDVFAHYCFYANSLFGRRNFQCDGIDLELGEFVTEVFRSVNCDDCIWTICDF